MHLGAWKTRLPKTDTKVYRVKSRPLLEHGRKAATRQQQDAVFADFACVARSLADKSHLNSPGSEVSHSVFPCKRTPQRRGRHSHRQVAQFASHRIEPSGPEGKRAGSGSTAGMSAYGYRDGYAPRRHTDDRRPRDSEERHREHGDSRSRAPASSRLAGQLPGPPVAATEPEAAAALPPPPALPPAPALAPAKPIEKEPPLDRTKVGLGGLMPALNRL